jgi:hypothetical protein
MHVRTLPTRATALPSQNIAREFLGVIVKAVGAIFAAAFAAVGAVLVIALWPVDKLVPAKIKGALFAPLFKFGYGCYLGRLGRWIHGCCCVTGSIQNPHTRHVTASVLSTCTVGPSTPPLVLHHGSSSPPHRPFPLSNAQVWPVPFSADNYAYLLVDSLDR